MGWIPKLFCLTAGLLIGLSGCDIDSKPKVLGKNSKFDFSSFDAGGFAFKINFALSAASRGRAGSVFLQGAANTKSGSIGTCNLAGTGCVCEFLTSGGAVLYTTRSSEISYDERGNYFTCTNSSSSSPTKIRIKNIAGTVVSNDFDIQSSVTLAQLIGNELDVNRVRTVFRYECEFNFLQKAGTTSQSFDCSNQATSCDPNPDPNKNFCILSAKFPFFLFSDTFSTNFFQKIADKVYNGTGTGKICGLSIKQINCVGADDGTNNFGTPVKKFGLFGQLTGIWETSVQLPAAPDQSASSFGFAARTSAVTNECPPGLVKKIFYTVTVDTSDISPSSNFVSAQVATEVGATTTTPTAFHIGKVSGGSGGKCDGSACTMPNSTVVAGAKPDQSYSSTGQTAFCVIPDTLLP